ncbi:PRC-barrel domain-containing protein [Phreatobacter sp. AB_2022a]|uniref:PRC-barrel domain-containing protein n=1 Tax=Phreatobacter sp. AB_2022a TaxID=3003134 RepID=UPI002286F861|nr:PRC-barrel domain-containing protein [Phreatobacter sp. AB_2022a]MCZ0738321.1 PRC-barrel domain-containing protein [Phreatobacter sp. AB_2022a]
MIRNKLALASVLVALSGGAMAQPAPTAPETPGRNAPAARQVQSSLAPNEFTTRSLIGMTVYAPKPAEGSASADPATTATVAPTPPASPATMDDAQWRAMRERHDNIGTVSSVVLTSDGRAKQVVLGVGGFLGIGEKSVALDWQDLRLMRDSNGKLFAVVMRTKEQLNAMPSFVDAAQ